MLLEAFLLRLLFAAIGLTLVTIGQFILLRQFDKIAGINFKASFDKIEQSPEALAEYYGRRWGGTILAVGMVVTAAMIL